MTLSLGTRGTDPFERALLHAQAELGDGYVLVEGRRVVEANETYLGLTGYTLAQLRDFSSLLEILAPEERARVTQRYLERGLAVPLDEHYETVIVRADGRRIHVELASVVVGDAERHLVLSIIRDITARKSAEQALRESQDRLLLLAQSALEGIAIHQGGFVQHVNPALERLLGYPSEEMRGRFIIDFVAPHDRERATDTMRTRSEAPYEADVTRKDGTTFPAEIVARTMSTAEGPVRVVAVRDISDRRAAEATKREQAVTRSVVRRLLRDLGRGGNASGPLRRELGHSLADETRACDMKGYAEAYRAMGLGELTIRLDDIARGRVEVLGRDLLERTPGFLAPTCHVALGYLEAAVGALAGAPALGAETACQSQGVHECRFVVLVRNRG